MSLLSKVIVDKKSSAGIEYFHKMLCALFVYCLLSPAIRESFSDESISDDIIKMNRYAYNSVEEHDYLHYQEPCCPMVYPVCPVRFGCHTDFYKLANYINIYKKMPIYML